MVANGFHNRSQLGLGLLHINPDLLLQLLDYRLKLGFELCHLLVVFLRVLPQHRFKLLTVFIEVLLYNLTQFLALRLKLLAQLVQIMRKPRTNTRKGLNNLGSNSLTDWGKGFRGSLESGLNVVQALSEACPMQKREGKKKNN